MCRQARAFRRDVALHGLPPTTRDRRLPALKLGGARGTVRRADGMLLEGIAVQLIAVKTAVRTTVYTNQDGRYEFPQLEADTYTLRIARPMEFKPWVKEGVRVSGAPVFDDIVLPARATPSSCRRRPRWWRN